LADRGKLRVARPERKEPLKLGVDTMKPAVVAIDLHRGHLDPKVATMPLAAPKAARVVAANQRFLQRCRDAGIPVVHLLTQYRDAEEIRANPFWRTRAENPDNPRKNVLAHNLEGMPGCTVMPEVWRGGDWLVDTKKRYDCFVGTDLDFLLRSHGVNTLYVTGVNTNSCVLSTVAAACSRDYAVVVVEDCVDTMDGPALHDAALACIRTAFGFVMTADEIQPAPVAA
jgi:nicotinamidase-related amidase